MDDIEQAMAKLRRRLYLPTGINQPDSWALGEEAHFSFVLSDTKETGLSLSLITRASHTLSEDTIQVSYLIQEQMKKPVVEVIPIGGLRLNRFAEVLCFPTGPIKLTMTRCGEYAGKIELMGLLVS